LEVACFKIENGQLTGPAGTFNIESIQLAGIESIRLAGRDEKESA